MHLLLVTGKPFSCECQKCHTKGMAGDTERGVLKFYVDTHGRPFVDYYCHMCVESVESLKA